MIRENRRSLHNLDAAEHLICWEISPQTVRLDEGRTVDTIRTLQIKFK